MNNKKIVITRPMLQSDRFKRQLIDAGVDKNQLIVSPVIEIKKVNNEPKIEKNSIILFTSENAVLNWDCTNKNKFSCYCVGLNTTNSAKKLGLNSKFLGKDIKSFVKNFPQDGKNEYHYLRGEDITFDLSSSLKRMGLKIRETIVYKQLSKNLSDQAKLSLQSNEETTIIVFSNLSALAILNDLDKIKLSNTEFLCLSANIEKTLKTRGIKNTRISNQPTVENLISILTG